MAVKEESGLHRPDLFAAKKHDIAIAGVIMLERITC
jgi:hypothetical protein